ncbi:MAG TPA: hypothetical protein VFN57_03585, partial [Thermomicrobiaceae bacterium]|nr:hypothetical protein [Thermomicrobiaceae bacterium]
MPRLEITAPLTLFAPAKLNLGLEVLGRRDDGMHEVATILQTVSFFDRIDLLPSDRPRYEPLPGVDHEHDLVWRALRAADEQLGIQLAAEVRLRKSIPVAAGLGGGSSDAGTLLGALAALVGTGASNAEGAAAELGSDVPFFVRGGTAVARGTGTDVRGLPPLLRAWFTVVTQGIDIPDKTRTLYRELRHEDMSDGADTERLVKRISEGEALDSGLLRSSFARPLFERPAVREAVAALQA